MSIKALALAGETPALAKAEENNCLLLMRTLRKQEEPGCGKGKPGLTLSS